MSEAGYNGERCGSCVLIEECDNVFVGSIPCDDFQPSLQCRRVRAEEEANLLRRERNGLLERIATALGRATVHLETIAEDQASANEPDCALGCRCPDCG